MAIQSLDGHIVYVVVIPTNPLSLLPIRWDTSLEKVYAQALEAAIRDGVINKPGKYGIEIGFNFETSEQTYNVYNIQEAA